jgi:hypothetical protein
MIPSLFLIKYDFKELKSLLLKLLLRSREIDPSL